MLTWIEIAFRNLWKNRRRSLFTILTVALGFAAVNVFGGFSSYVFTTIKDGEIYALGNGHLTIFKKGFLTHGKLDPLSYLLGETETQTIQEVLRGFSEVAIVTRQLHISGLLSNGKVSTIFIAAGYVPSDMQTIKNYASGMMRRLRLFAGKNLKDDTPRGVGLSSGLAEQLELGLDSTAIMMAPTVDGQINALDIEVFQLFETEIDVLNDKLMRIPLELAQTLYDTNSVDRITVVLKDTEQVEPVRAALTEALARRGLDVEIKTWRELSALYNKVKAMFDVIFLFLFIVVLIIAAMSVINTISMTVVERTREIGTLRALGVKRRGILKLFALESIMLGILGSLGGTGLTWISWLIVKTWEPQWVPPLISRRLPLAIELVPQYMVWSAFFLVVLSVGAASFPARRAAHQAIVEALGHV